MAQLRLLRDCKFFSYSVNSESPVLSNLQTCDTPSSESDRLLRVQREIPPHLDRSFRPSQASHVSKSNNSRSKQCQLCQDVLPDSKSLKAVSSVLCGM